MAPKNKSYRNPLTRTDHHYPEKIFLQHLDPRITDISTKDFNNEVVCIDDKLYVPLKSVEAMLVDNVQMKESIMLQQNTHYSRVIEYISQRYVGMGTSTINKAVDRISANYGGWTKPEVYNFIYNIMEHSFFVKFDAKLPHESKLQFAFRIGALPIVAMLVTCLDYILFKQAHLAPSESHALNRKLSDKLKAKYQKNKPKVKNPYGKV